MCVCVCVYTHTHLHSNSPSKQTKHIATPLFFRFSKITPHASNTCPERRAESPHTQPQTTKKQSANIPWRNKLRIYERMFTPCGQCIHKHTLASKEKPSTPKFFVNTLTSVDIFSRVHHSRNCQTDPTSPLKMVADALTKSVLLLYVARQVTPQVKSSVTCDVIWSHVKWRVTCYVTWLATWRDVTWRDVTWRDVTWRDVTSQVRTCPFALKFASKCCSCISNTAIRCMSRLLKMIGLFCRISSLL